MMLRRVRAAIVLQGVAASIAALLGVMPGGYWLTIPLETWFPANPALPEHVAGIIALGGTERVAQSEAWGQPTLSDPTPIAALISLGRRYPEAKLVFSGGGQSRPNGTLTEADVVRTFLDEIGIGGDRVIYEPRSRNTFENAAFSRDLIHPNAGDRWILVTQATSMPRAVAAFRHAGWDVIPFPAGYVTDREPGFLLSFRLRSGLSLASIALHEWGGLIVYRLMGYTDELFPR
jgi:uncharacterized SAM-binding protein YcdF (DUF218 family)